MYYTWTILIIIIAIGNAPGVHCNKGEKLGKTCRHNFTIHNSVDEFKSLANCSYIDGYVRIHNLELDDTDTLNSVSFPKLIEISDYLLIYRVVKATTLEKWFPNLRYIRGRRLFFGYALVINGLQEVQRLGFDSLEHIKGAVRIEMVDKLCISRYARDYRTIAKAMFKHSDEHKLVTNSHLPGLRSRPVSPKELLLDLNTNSTQGLPTNSTDGYFQLHVTEIYEFPNETYVERQSCNSGRNILQLNDSTVCSLRSPDLRKGQRLIFYYMGRPVESEDDFLNKKIMPFTHFKFNNNHDYNNDNTTGGVKFKLPIYQYISYKEAKAPLNATSLFATTFRHYTQYYIVLEICTHHKGVLTCKPVDHIKTKTLPSPTADYIYDNAMYETVNGTNATINWSEPLEPNGAVISYDIQYFKSTEFTDKAKAEYGDKICLNQWQYLLNSNSFTMTGLDPGTNYSYRVRANSIHGTGNWTTIHTFTVPGENWTTINYIINFARFIKHGII